MKKQILTILLTLFCGIVVMAQPPKKVTGVVTDKSGEPLIGATVIVQGGKQGTMTDADGKYTIANVPADGSLLFSYVGMVTQTIEVGDKSVINVVLLDDALDLEEVVVIGYGSAKAKDLTAPIAVVKGDDLQNIPSSSPMAALSGKVPGVNIINSGTPGDGPTVQIRGVGSFTASTPLYVVDGVFYDNINFLSNSDIQEISILKDASAAAIYGVKAANGVVIVTTKKGTRNQPAKVTYDGYIGFQKATNVLEMCNSAQYAEMLMEGNADAYKSILQASIDRYGGDLSSYTFGADTDWYDELLRTAVITSHSLSVSGGSDRATYALGMNYLYQDGIMDTDNYYKRLNFRAQLDYDVYSWLSVGFSGVFSNGTQKLSDNSAWQQAFNMAPIMPVYDETNEDTYPTKYASPGDLGYTSNFYNPVATADYYNAKNDTYQTLANFYANFKILPNKLDFRTSYGYDHSTVKGIVIQEPYYVSAYQLLSTSSLQKTSTEYNKWVWDNVLTYKDKIGLHNFGATLGFSIREERYSYLLGSVSDVPTESSTYWYISQGDESTATSSDDGTRYRSQSYFARLNYDYDGKYLLMFTMRADGTSKYQEKWGYFPSVGGAWVISSEPFMKDQNWADYLKLRASWGLLGNDGVAASDGYASITTGDSASGVFGSYGSSIGTTYSGYQNTTFYSYLKWEKVSETNVGVTYATLQNRLSLDVDWFYRLTTDAVISAALPFSTTTLAGNYGKILNTGFDITVNWADKVGDFNYYVAANVGTLHNEVKSLSGLSYVLGGKTINMVGEKMNSYYGYIVEGVYQTQDEVDADPVAVANSLEPGDFKYKDVNGDGTIDGDDRVALGSYIPSFTYGINFGFSYKNWDFSVSTYGQHGAKIFNRKRQLRYAQANYNFDLDLYKNRWTGEGSTNSYPSAAGLLKSWNVNSSATSTNSFFVESADYFRIQNVNVGYTLRNLKMGAYTLPSLRLSLTADRPLTLFGYNGYTPEISDSEGWDTQTYPLTSTYTFGVQIQF